MYVRFKVIEQNEKEEEEGDHNLSKEEEPFLCSFSSGQPPLSKKLEFSTTLVTTQVDNFIGIIGESEKLGFLGKKQSPEAPLKYGIGIFDPENDEISLFAPVKHFICQQFLRPNSNSTSSNENQQQKPDSNEYKDQNSSNREKRRKIVDEFGPSKLRKALAQTDRFQMDVMSPNMISTLEKDVAIMNKEETEGSNSGLNFGRSDLPSGIFPNAVNPKDIYPLTSIIPEEFLLDHRLSYFDILLDLKLEDNKKKFKDMASKIAERFWNLDLPSVKDICASYLYPSILQKLSSISIQNSDLEKFKTLLKTLQYFTLLLRLVDMPTRGISHAQLKRKICKPFEATVIVPKKNNEVLAEMEDIGNTIMEGKDDHYDYVIDDVMTEHLASSFMEARYDQSQEFMNFHLPPDSRDKIISHLCILYLHLNEFNRVDPLKLANALKLPQNKMSLHFQSIGCSLLRKKKDATESTDGNGTPYLEAVLKAPLKLPAIRGNGRKSIKRNL